MGPRCFESHLYHIGISNPHDRQCICPTEKGWRCRFTIREGELAEANDLILEAEDLPDDEDRDVVLQRLVLLRICGNVHRVKLDANPRCVAEVARRYGRLISTASSGSRQNSQSPGTLQRRPPRNEPAHWSDQGKLRPYYQLRPRDEQGKAITNLSRSGPVFAPYSLGNTVKEIMLNAVPFDHAGYGHVYAYTWPEHPGFVKIGYTTNLQSRMSAWDVCMPGLKLLTHVTVPFPARVEELVHLELNDVRQMIQRCRSCDKLHHEWFKATTDETLKILNGWRDVVERQPLYDSSRRLTEPWKARLSSIATRITAQKLLSILDAEAELARFQQAELARIKEQELVKAREAELARIEQEKLTKIKEEELCRTKAEQLAQAIKDNSARIRETSARINEKKVARAKKVELDIFCWEQVLDIFEDFMASLAVQETKILPAIEKSQQSISGTLHAGGLIPVS